MTLACPPPIPNVWALSVTGEELIMVIMFLAKLMGFFRHISRRAAVFIYSLPNPLFPIRYTLRKGQNTVEYLLMLAVVASVALAMGILFHKKILGGIFTMVGMIIGAGPPK